MEITEGTEPGKASVGNNDVKTTEGVDRFFDETNVVCCHSSVLTVLKQGPYDEASVAYGLDHCGLDPILIGADLGDLVCPLLAGDIVYNNIAAFFSKLLA